MKDKYFAKMVKSLRLEEVVNEFSGVQGSTRIYSCQPVTQQVTPQQKICSSASPEGKPSTKQYVTQEKVDRN